jgi:hypothetical protein
VFAFRVWRSLLALWNRGARRRPHFRTSIQNGGDDETGGQNDDGQNGGEDFQIVHLLAPFR